MRYQPARQTDRQGERDREREGKREVVSSGAVAHSMQISVTSGELIENL